jgi:hypothetical protein
LVREAASIETYQNTIFAHFSEDIKKGEKVSVGCKDRPMAQVCGAQRFLLQKTGVTHHF